MHVSYHWHSWWKAAGGLQMPAAQHRAACEVFKALLSSGLPGLPVTVAALSRRQQTWEVWPLGPLDELRCIAAGAALPSACRVFARDALEKNEEGGRHSNNVDNSPSQVSATVGRRQFWLRCVLLCNPHLHMEEARTCVLVLGGAAAAASSCKQARHTHNT